MSGMEDIAELLQSFMGASSNSGSDESSTAENDDNNASGGGLGGFDDLFGGIDIEMIMKLGSLFSEMQKPDKHTALLNALKPIVRTENQEKIDTATKLIRMMAILPYLRESGLMDKLF